MEGILGVLFILALFIGVPTLFILGPSLVQYLITGKTPSQVAYERDAKRREEHIMRGDVDGMMDREAMRRYLDKR
ncbi:hypothetical protein [Mycolicibacterium porcinum]|uniref:hypothetical protein n=1 Tax=Mycolicibacterium porcinum TaxID=39693 RepID=UPI0008491C32|nr:hypothetical protein [Mycolicibacterium porcinum]ODR25334.1 hypothetical protein BHQ19_12755 [Mycolicibacterium porcinum]